MGREGKREREKDFWTNRMSENGRSNELTNKRTDRYRRSDRWIDADGQTDRKAYKQTDRQAEWLKDRRTDELIQTDGRVEKQTNKQTHIYWWTCKPYKMQLNYVNCTSIFALVRPSVTVSPSVLLRLSVLRVATAVRPSVLWSESVSLCSSKCPSVRPFVRPVKIFTADISDPSCHEASKRSTFQPLPH